MKYTITGSKLNVGEKCVSFSHAIRDVKEISNILVVLLDIPSNDNSVDNLYAVNEKGDIVWDVQHIAEVYPTERILPYEQIVIKDQEIRAMDFYGRCYFINPSDGKILKRVIYK